MIHGEDSSRRKHTDKISQGRNLPGIREASGAEEKEANELRFGNE